MKFNLSSFISVLILTGLIAVIFSSLPRAIAQDPITLNPIADSYVDTEYPYTNFGTADTLNVDFINFSLSHDEIRDSYLLFDLSEISSETNNIESVLLGLYCYSVGETTAQIGAHLCSDTQWNEIELTLTNAPSYKVTPLDVIDVAFEDQYYYWNVTDAVKNSQREYLTIVLTVEEGEDSYSTGFHSKDFINQPELVIEYETNSAPQPPVASFSYSPLEPKVNDTITFDSSTSNDPDGIIVSYFWDFGDGHTSTSQNPTHTYDIEGSYTVTLTVIDNDGLTDTITLSITDIVIPEFNSWPIFLILIIETLGLLLIKNKIDLKH